MIAVAAAPTARLVSPMQAALGTFLGGPIGFVFFSRANCAALGDRVGARRMLALSISVVLAWHAAVALAFSAAAEVALNLLFGGTPFVLMAAAHHLAEQQAASAPGHSVFRSGWSVCGITLLCFAASVACVLAVIAAVLVGLLATSGFR